MSIIFEGVDGTGKTTAAKSWCNFYSSYGYIHNFAKPSKPDDIRSEMFKEITLLMSPNDFVLDRSYIISEYIYATVLNRPTVITLEHLFNFTKLLNMYEHTVMLYTYLNLDNVHYKEEDAKLPFTALNAYYIEIVQHTLPIEKRIVTLIDNRRTI